MTGTVEKVGEGDLSLRTEVTTADEIGTLGKEFNHMLDYIEALIAQVIEEYCGPLLPLWKKDWIGLLANAPASFR